MPMGKEGKSLSVCWSRLGENRATTRAVRRRIDDEGEAATALLHGQHMPMGKEGKPLSASGREQSEPSPSHLS